MIFPLFHAQGMAASGFDGLLSFMVVHLGLRDPSACDRALGAKPTAVTSLAN
jgi:hypothetical protein